ncbi:MAG: hypothetical protein H2057_05645 [Alphaproteobacteria bacterium]|nr:hypothetical protein [Alphaproteobacteria bacterium]
MKNKTIFVTSLILSISATSFSMASCQEEEEVGARFSIMTPVQALEEIVEQAVGVASLVVFYDRVAKEETSSCFGRVQEFFEALSRPENQNWKEKAAAYLGLGLMCHKGHYVPALVELFEDHDTKRRADLKRAWHYAKKARKTFRASPGTQQSAKRLMIALLCDPLFELEGPVTDLDRYDALGRLKSVLEPDEVLHINCRDERLRLAKSMALRGPRRLRLVAYEHILQDQKSTPSLKESARHRRRKLLQKTVSENRTCARTRAYVESLS